MVCSGSRAHISEHFLGKLTVAKFTQITPIIPDRVITLSWTFLPGRTGVEAAPESSKGFA